MTPYTGRFAPSPTGLLHAGSLVRPGLVARRRAHGALAGPIEDSTDTQRRRRRRGDPRQLARCGLVADEAPAWQSDRIALYEQALAP